MSRLAAAACAFGVAAAQYAWQEKWTTSFIDNFNAWGDLSTATYQQRYLINDTWYKPGGPIFFYTGNEGDITLFAANTGFLWEIAPSHNALVVFAEHRYYGESMPFGAASYDTANLWALSSEQALADYAALLDSLKANMSIPDAPVVSFGGSYGGERRGKALKGLRDAGGCAGAVLSVVRLLGRCPTCCAPAAAPRIALHAGMLAAWFRMKYPASTIGSIAASAPILQFTGITDPTGACARACVVCQWSPWPPLPLLRRHLCAFACPWVLQSSTRSSRGRSRPLTRSHPRPSTTRGGS